MRHVAFTGTREGGEVMGPFGCRIHGVPVGVCGCDPTRIKWTFTGVDGRTDLDLVSLISTQHTSRSYNVTCPKCREMLRKRKGL